VQAEERCLARPEAELPHDVVGRAAGGRDHAQMNGVQVMRSADGDAVPSLVAAASRAIGDVVIVKTAAARAAGHGAAPAVACEDRIAMARLRFPLGDRVLKQTFEGMGIRIFGGSRVWGPGLSRRLPLTRASRGLSPRGRDAGDVDRHFAAGFGGHRFGEPARPRSCRAPAQATTSPSRRTRSRTTSALDSTTAHRARTPRRSAAALPAAPRRRKALQLAPRDPEPLARVVPDPRESERMMPAARPSSRRVAASSRVSRARSPSSPRKPASGAGSSAIDRTASIGEDFAKSSGAVNPKLSPPAPARYQHSA
jgi:hypothetical protein